MASLNPFCVLNAEGRIVMGSVDMRLPGVSYYPIFVSLDEKVCLVIGGGRVGERKIRTLLRTGAHIRLIAQDLTPWLVTQYEEGNISLLGSNYDSTCLQDVDLVFAATSDATLNRQIAEDAHSRKIWCNMASDPDLGSFIVPATFQRGPLTIAISTSGSSPALAKLIREKLEKEFGPGWATSLVMMDLLRKAIQEKDLGSTHNQEIFGAVASLPIPEWIEKGERHLVLKALHEICHPVLDRDALDHIMDEAWKASF